MKLVAVVTGVASGIGLYVATNLKAQGVEVFGLDIKKVDIKRIKCFECNVGNEEDVLNCINEIAAIAGKIDYLVNAAGIFCCENRYHIEDLPLCEWEKVFEANLKSVFLMTKHAIPLLKKSKKGSIINFSSDQVVIAQAKSVPYAVTKAAVEMFTKITAKELLNEEIRVNTIALASVKTGFLKNYIKDDEKIAEMMVRSEREMPFGLIESKDVFTLVQYLLYDNCKMTGQTLLMDSGVTLDVNKKRSGGKNDA